MHVFDWAETLKKYKGNEKIATEMTVTFFAELADAQKAVNTAFIHKNPEKLYEAIHKLHGSCCFFTVPEFKAICRKFCDAVHHCQKHEIDTFRFLLDDFNSACLHLISYEKDFQ
jgi:HPt (histidine-containing phosphotransfer) domain-containing protein